MAVKLFDIYIKAEQNDPLAYEGRAKTHFLTDKIEKAIVDYTKAIELSDHFL